MMNFTTIASRDPYLAGYIAARESYSDSVYLNTSGDLETGYPTVDQILKPFIFLSPDQQARFKQGWEQGRADCEQEQKERSEQELERLLDACSDGYDPAVRTKWEGIV